MSGPDHLLDVHRDNAQRPVSGGDGPSARQLVLAAGALLIAAQVGLRGWALYGSWFYVDDLRLVMQAAGEGLSLDYLIRPYDSQFMPFGRLLASMVESLGTLSWPVVATTTLVLQLLASVACLWMLTTLFGVRWGVLGPLALYLFSPMTLPATMWWAAGLNQLPLQITFFAAVATWTAYLRRPSIPRLVIPLLILALGLLAYVKTLLVFIVLAYLALAYFSSGSPRRRLVSCVRRYWPAAVGGVALGTGFLVYYVTQVPQLLDASGDVAAGRLADRMLGTSLSVGIVGGPWRWDLPIPPVGLADPPAWSVHLSWVLIALAVAYLALRRVRTGRAWALLALYVGGAYLLLLTTRAPIVGSIAGLEYRYLTDTACALVLCIGLVTMPLLGARESSALREPPLLTVPVGRVATTVGVVLVCGSGVFTSVRYVDAWHHDNPTTHYFGTATSGLQGRGPVDLANQAVPDRVIPGFWSPDNTTERLLPLFVDNASFPESTSRLVILNENGVPEVAGIDAAVRSRPGPVTGCGWKVGSGDVTIPLEHATIDFDWWLRIGYLASTDDTMTVRVGDSEEEVDVIRGLNSAFVHVVDAFSSVTLGGLREPGSRVCVDVVDVGQPEPAGPL